MEMTSTDPAKRPVPTGLVLGAFRRDLIAAGITADVANDLLRAIARDLVERTGLVTTNV